EHGVDFAQALRVAVVAEVDGGREDGGLGRPGRSGVVADIAGGEARHMRGRHRRALPVVRIVARRLCLDRVDEAPRRDHVRFGESVGRRTARGIAGYVIGERTAYVVIVDGADGQGALRVAGCGDGAGARAAVSGGDHGEDTIAVDLVDLARL